MSTNFKCSFYLNTLSPVLVPEKGFTIISHFLPDHRDFVAESGSNRDPPKLKVGLI